MAPSVSQSGSGSAAFSHRRACYLLLAIIVPFAVPFLILCIPLLLLLFAPLIPFLLSLLILYKLPAYFKLRSWGSRTKDAVLQQLGFTDASSSDSDKQRLLSPSSPEILEEGDDANVQSSATSDVGSREDMFSADDVCSAASSDGGLMKDEHRDVKEFGREKPLWKGKGTDDIQEGLAYPLGEREENLEVASSFGTLTCGMPEDSKEESASTGGFQDHLCAYLPSSNEKEGKAHRENLPAPEYGIHEYTGGIDEVAVSRREDESPLAGMHASDLTETQEHSKEYNREKCLLPAQSQVECDSSDLSGLDTQEEQGLPATSSEKDGAQQHCHFAAAAAGIPRPGDGPLLEQSSSSTLSKPQSAFIDPESQEETQEEHKLLADIRAIQEIVGYQGETHASAMEQIMALHLFLGMEPCELDEEMDALDRARAHTELLKRVVGVK